MRDKIRNNKNKEQGSAMLITTIILLVLMVIVATTISISGMQLDLAVLNRNTSNTYYLAKSAVEKQVDTMNKALESQMSQIIKDISKDSIDKLAPISGSPIYDTFEYDTTTHKIVVKDTIIKTQFEDKIYDYLVESYKTKIVTTPIPGPIDSATGKDPIVYTAQSDSAQSGYYTEVKIIITDKDDTGTTIGKPFLRVIATATTKTLATPTTIYDQQTVEGLVEIKLPDVIDNQIHEKYAFDSPTAAPTAVPELFNSALLSFSDVVVGTGGKLIVNGDMRVTGEQDIAKFGADQYPEVDQNGGVIAVNGGDIQVNGNLYSTNNVLASSGWGAGTYTDGGKINVTGDVIAYTVGIVDDFYEGSINQSPFSESNQVKNASITVGRNVMVDNDVMIDRWVKDCDITVGDTIFGINGGSDPATDIDPNQSSGIFSQGPGSQIISNGMYVAGQPYITLASNKKPLKLWESIGEPFNGVASFEGYATFDDVNVNPANPNYLLPTSPFHSLISGDKVKTDFAKTYAVAKISAININSGVVASTPNEVDRTFIGEDCKNGLSNQSEAVLFFYQGSSGHPYFDELTASSNDPEGVQNVIDNLTAYYDGTNENVFKDISANAPSNNFKGLRGYMTIMRSVFYKGFDSTTRLPDKETFGTALNRSVLPSILPSVTTSNPTPSPGVGTWSYETPICIVEGGIVDISKFYVAVGTGSPAAHPSIIISKGNTNKLTLKASEAGKNEFKGIIISEGPIEFDFVTTRNLSINGSVIIGGPEDMPSPSSEDRSAIFAGDHAGLIVKGGEVTITSDSSVLPKIAVKDRELYRKILDFLYMTDYSNEDLTDIMNKQGENAKATLKYTDKSILEVDTKGIEIAIKSLKKTQ